MNFTVITPEQEKRLRDLEAVAQETVDFWNRVEGVRMLSSTEEQLREKFQDALKAN